MGKKLLAKKSRRDETLLTVGFNLRNIPIESEVPQGRNSINRRFQPTEHTD